MNSDLKDILSNLSNEVDQEKLLDYLNKKLAASDAHEVEKQMVNDEFTNDAVEGLEKFNNKKQISSIVEQLNNNLKLQLAKKKKRKAKRVLKDQSLVYFTIILLLLLIVLSYLLIKKYLSF